MTTAQANLLWQVGLDRTLSLATPRLMGILNVTPDSFSDGGDFVSVEAAIGRAIRLNTEGAVIIDIGGESTRPGAECVSASDQMARTVPVITGLRALISPEQALISIDTTSADVAAAALEAGANIVNDVSAGTDDPRLFDVVAEHQCGLILMHRIAPPDGDVYSDQYEQAPAYGDVVDDVLTFLNARADAALAAGVAEAAIAIDPGLGFGKTVEQNFELIGRIGELAAAGRPLVLGSSRKSFLGVATGITEPRERVRASVAASVAQYLAGARVFRVHDVNAHAEALAVAQAIEAASPAPRV